MHSLMNSRRHLPEIMTASEWPYPLAPCADIDPIHRCYDNYCVLSVYSEQRSTDESTGAVDLDALFGT